MITEENKLPEAILVIANPIPRTNNGGISPKLGAAQPDKSKTRGIVLYIRIPPEFR